MMDVVPSHNHNFYSEEAREGRGVGLRGEIKKYKQHLTRKRYHAKEIPKYYMSGTGN